MKTRNKSLLSSKVNNKNKSLSKLKDSKLINRKETTKDVSYRDQHNIGRRKSTSSVVTYSLDSRLFFDVYAKFNNENLPKKRNVYNGICNNSSPSNANIVKKTSDIKTKPLTILASKRHLNSENYSDKDSQDDDSEVSSKRKIIKVSYEAKPLNSDEACIPSPKIPSDLPITNDKLNKAYHSNENRIISTRKSQPNTVINENSTKSEIPLKTTTKNETFQKLLENRTVFKKHLSKNLLDKVKSNRKLTKPAITSSNDSRRLSSRLNKSLNDADSIYQSSDGNIISPVKSKKLKRSESTNPTNDLKLDLSPPKRGKRIASLNAAAIINCVQNLFNESPKHSPIRQNRRRISKSDNIHESTQTKENEIESLNRNKPHSKINCNKIPLNSTVDKETSDTNISSTTNSRKSPSPPKSREKIPKTLDEKELKKSEKNIVNNKTQEKSIQKEEKSNKIKENIKDHCKQPKKSIESDEKQKKSTEDVKKPKKSINDSKKPKKPIENGKKIKQSIENKNQKRSIENENKSKNPNGKKNKTVTPVENVKSIITTMKEEFIENADEKSNNIIEENSQSNKIDKRPEEIPSSNTDEKSNKKFDEPQKPTDKDKSIKNHVDFTKSQEIDGKTNSTISQNSKNPKRNTSNSKNNNLSRFFDITKRSHSNKRHVDSASVPNSQAKKPKTFTVERIVRRKPKSVDQCFDELSRLTAANKKSKKQQQLDEKQANEGNDKNDENSAEDNDDDDNGESFWEWVGEPFHKSIQLQLAGEIVDKTCYNAIRHTRDDVIIRSLDCVMLRSSADQEPFLAKIIVFYLDEETGKKMMTLFWYYRPEHTEQGLLDWHTESDVYASRHLDSNSVDCIEDKAFVLPVEIYSRFVAYQKRQGSGTRPGLAARLIPVSNDDTVVTEPDDSKADNYTDVFISSWYYTLNFQNSFPPEMTNSNVFVCRGLYDINQHKITRNILQNIQSPKLELTDPCESVDSAMSISSCESEHKHQQQDAAAAALTVVIPTNEIETPLSDIPIPPCKTEEVATKCLPPISSFHSRLPLLQLDTTVPVAKSCPPPPASKPIQPPLPNSTNGDVRDCPKQPNGHP